MRQIRRIIRDRHLTPEEVERYRLIRQQIEADLPDLIAQHHERMKDVMISPPRYIKRNEDQSDLPMLDSLTKYPSIPTYHDIGDRGRLLPTIRTPFAHNVEIIVTEKVDGSNGRIILFPDGSYVIGSRDALLHASGDMIYNEDMRIVETILAKQTIDHFTHCDPKIGIGASIFAPQVAVIFVEVFGSNIGKGGKQYCGTANLTSLRVFDICTFDEDDLRDKLLSWPKEKSPDWVAGWREHGGQRFLTEFEIKNKLPKAVPLTQRVHGESLLTVGVNLPTGIPETLDWMEQMIKKTECDLASDAGGKPEGLVIRTPDRSVIAKLRFEDYERTLR